MGTWLATYIDVLETLSPDNLSRLKACTAEQIEFKDPFNYTTTQGDFIALMADMYSRLDHVRFEVNHSIESEGEAFIEWTFYAESTLTGKFSFVGTSRLKSDQAGRVVQHFDYWDGSTLMETIPLIGLFIKRLRNRLSHRE
ncbi:MAG: hypothetical protein AXW15_10760 [Neptuniibacter sp. Phe_28]|nr:MAG: hypothetical protein AXW15_10760 [Neptuniibacter sp. Phe_28]